MVDDSPATNAIITLVPVDPSNSNSVNPTGLVQADGSFHFTTYKPKDGAPEGEYIVLVDWTRVDPKTKAEQALVSSRYCNPKESDLRVRISSGMTELPPLSIRSIVSERAGRGYRSR